MLQNVATSKYVKMLDIKKYLIYMKYLEKPNL
jgi:hypothetical protein